MFQASLALAAVKVFNLSLVSGSFVFAHEIALLHKKRRVM